ncbi:MAG: endonuclease/exonuclease/phosphatase family protein [Clostridia bacterium]|nr:endonuclease/exonuclease/phosphatase family protein [Clostridia bacterium]
MIVTLMTSNIWADVFGNPVKDRDSALVALLRRYAPDVLMLQEVHPNWHKSEVLKAGFRECGYKVSEPDLGGNTLNYTPLAYKASRFCEERSVFKLYDGLNDYTSKSVSGSLLREILPEGGQGKRFAAMSTHFYFAQNDEGNSARISNAKELTACFDALCPDGIPGFCGGDFNCDISSEPFALLNSNGIVCTSTITETRTNFIRTHHKNPEYDAEKHQYIPAKPSKKDNNLSIDHIVVRGSGVRILNYTVITDEEALILSDHCPVLIRAEF